MAEHVAMALPPTVWSFERDLPPDGRTLSPGTCVVKALYRAQREAICVSASAPGCRGAAFYLGVAAASPRAGAALALKERFKGSVALGEAFYREAAPPPATSKWLVIRSVESIDDRTVPEVVNLWVDAASLAALVTLANHDRAGNDDVLMPFSAGCQSLWTIPLQRAGRENGTCVAGLVDPAVRRWLPRDLLAFSTTRIGSSRLPHACPAAFSCPNTLLTPAMLNRRVLSYSNSSLEECRLLERGSQMSSSSGSRTLCSARDPRGRPTRNRMAGRSFRASGNSS
jgi:hypothetical protein